MSRPTILFAGGGTGGHVFPLVAVADAMGILEPDVDRVFVGTARGLEAKLVPARGYALELLEVLPLRGAGVVGAARGALRAGGAVREALALLRRLGPRAVFSVGGYAAGPVSLAAALLGVPLALIEPNSVIGFANRLIAPLVDRAYTAFEPVEHHFKKGRVLRAGVPIRTGFSPAPYTATTRPFPVLVLGGSQGARSLNEVVPRALAELGGELAIVHQAGPRDIDAVRALYDELGMGARVRTTPFIDDMPTELARAGLVIGRSGASAVSEICAVGRPSILVPYPFAAGDHQRKNALSLEREGAAETVPADRVTPTFLAGLIGRLLGDPARLEHMAAAARRLGKPDAATVIARDLLALAGLGGTEEDAAPPVERSGRANVGGSV
ncbi:MAG TPA: undecaprenyldiphospho-muramoylpentapeptide beta-N-acetylglucosaminyltransferase [Polyangiaceae bacterium]|nr:undecaprenyldiphospho-muramoylpentapeptide beta-N-acetylglucosaminyltransferase [Polyangiaceae bacterium]